MESDVPTFTTLVESLRYYAENCGPRPAFIFRDKHVGRYTLSWQQISDLGGRLAAVLKSRSLGQGDLVVNTLPNSPERVIAEVGILLSGAASVNGQCQLADGSDLLHVLRKSRAHAIILDPDVTNSPWKALQKHAELLNHNDEVTSKDFPHLKHVFFARRNAQKDEEDFLGHLEQLEDFFQADVRPDDTMTVFTTSGTTGFSKLVVYTHRTWASGYRPQNVELDRSIEFNLAPMGWPGGYVGSVIASGVARATLDVRAGGIPEDLAEFVWRCIQEEKCTRSIMLPAIVLQIAKSLQDKQANEDTEILHLTEKVQKMREDGGSNHEEDDGDLDDAAVYLTNRGQPINTEGKKSETNERSGVLQITIDRGAGEDGTNEKSNTRDKGNEVPESAQPTQGPEREKESSSGCYKLDLLIMGGLPITRAVVKAAYVISKSVLVTYGGTDIGFVSALRDPDPDTYVDYDSGTPAPPGEVMIVSEENENATGLADRQRCQPLPVGQTGHILVKLVALNMKEYLNDPETTAAALTHEGYFRTGDIGCVDDRGHLIVHGRGSDAIMRGPYIFYPGWLEARIRACPGVSDVMVVGVPDPLVNEELCACLVMTSDDVSVAQVRQFVEKDILASEDDPMSPRPRHYLRFESFPVTYTDKPQRLMIKEQASARLGSSP